MNILHKLGLYTKAETEELIAKTTNLIKSVDDVAAEADAKLKASNSIYKIAISCLNAANTVEHAVKVISDYCDTTDCIVCKFGGEKCKLAHTAPYDWEV